MDKKIGILIGSLREGSFSKKVATEIGAMLTAGYTPMFFDIGELELYNEDLEGDSQPDSWCRFRKFLTDLDAVIFVTPEYNRSLPGVLKNALDIGSRPPDKSYWGKKPAGIISLSIGMYGGFGANHHLRQSLAFLNLPTMGQPEIYLSNVHEIFDEHGKINNERTKSYLKNFVDSYISWINLFI